MICPLQYFFKVVGVRCAVFAVLARPDQLNLMLAMLQSGDHAADRHCHAVYFRRIRFRHHGDAQNPARDRYLRTNDFRAVHAFIMQRQQENLIKNL